MATFSSKKDSSDGGRKRSNEFNYLINNFERDVAFSLKHNYKK